MKTYNITLKGEVLDGPFNDLQDAIEHAKEYAAAYPKGKSLTLILVELPSNNPIRKFPTP